MAGLSKDKLVEALTIISGHLDQKFEGQAFLSLAGTHYMLSVRELTGIEHFSSKDPQEIIDRLLPRSKVEVTVLSDQVDAIYAAYPRRRDPGAAKPAIKAALKDADIPHENKFAYLLAAVEMFAEFCRRTMTEEERKTYIPYPAKWMRRKSYLNGDPAKVLRWMAGQRPAKATGLPNEWNVRPEAAAS